MSLCSPVTCPCPQREDFLNFCISESLHKQGEVSREVVFLLCRTKCPENEPPGLSPPPPNPPPPRTPDLPWGDASELGRCPGAQGSLGTPACWAVGFSRRLLGQAGLCLWCGWTLQGYCWGRDWVAGKFQEQTSQRHEWLSRDENPKTSC